MANLSFYSLYNMSSYQVFINPVFTHNWVLEFGQRTWLESQQSCKKNDPHIILRKKEIFICANPAESLFVSAHALLNTYLKIELWNPSEAQMSGCAALPSSQLCCLWIPSLCSYSAMGQRHTVASLYRARTVVILDAHSNVQETEASVREGPRPIGPETTLGDLLPKGTQACPWLWSQRVNWDEWEEVGATSVSLGNWKQLDYILPHR